MYYTRLVQYITEWRDTEYEIIYRNTNHWNEAADTRMKEIRMVKSSACIRFESGI